MGLFDFFSKRLDPISPAEKYLAYLENIFHQKPLIFKADSLIDGIPGIVSIVYPDIPKPGYTTAFTYGLSLVQHPAWKFGRPELCLSVASVDEHWWPLVGHVANNLRGDCPFSYGNIINFGEKFSPDSEMDAFLIFAPSSLAKGNYTNIDIGTDYKINIAGLYPMYSDEIEVLNKIGLKDFWHHPDFDNYSVSRSRILHH